MITALRSKTPTQVHGDVAGFATRYVEDWKRWSLAAPDERPALFVKTLGNWQATRPAKLRRLRVRAGEHPPPYIEDLLKSAAPHLHVLRNFEVGQTGPVKRSERTALAALWKVLSSLQQGGKSASCVAITKAVLLLSNGRIGPAFDSQVRRKLDVKHLRTAADWISALADVSADIRAFEERYRVSLSKVVPSKYANLGYGRLYDMALGPRSPNKDLQPSATSAMMRRRG